MLQLSRRTGTFHSRKIASKHRASLNMQTLLKQAHLLSNWKWKTSGSLMTRANAT